jgi:hypothetical protein
MKLQIFGTIHPMTQQHIPEDLEQQKKWNVL